MLLFIVLLPTVLCDNWAVILNSSKFYFNYRHTVNALLMYQFIKRQGIPDENIILMLPENIACNSRNSYPGKVYDGSSRDDLYGGSIEVDYRGKEITPSSIINLLEGNYHPSLPKNKRLESGPDSNVFIYLNGHGGDSYLKIQDTLVLKNTPFAKAIEEMHRRNRFKELLVILDTCQAFSLFDYVNTPNVHMIASSLTHQMALSIGTETELGISTSDHFTFFFYEFVNKHKNFTSLTVSDVTRNLPFSKIKADIGFKSYKSQQSINLSKFMSRKNATKTGQVQSTFEASSGNPRSHAKSEDFQFHVGNKVHSGFVQFNYHSAGVIVLGIAILLSFKYI